jgi:hypothetical protein
LVGVLQVEVELTAKNTYSKMKMQGGGLLSNSGFIEFVLVLT